MRLTWASVQECHPSTSECNPWKDQLPVRAGLVAVRSAVAIRPLNQPLLHQRAQTRNAGVSFGRRERLVDRLCDGRSGSGSRSHP